MKPSRPALAVLTLLLVAGGAGAVWAASSDPGPEGGGPSSRPASAPVAEGGDAPAPGSATDVDAPAPVAGRPTRGRPAYDVLVELSDRADRVSRRVAGLEMVARDLRVWFGCVSYLPVTRAGDPDHRWGFRYDERDGTGVDTRPALVRHTGPTRPDLVMLRMARRPACLSAAPDPNGTGDDARVAAEEARRTSPGAVRRLTLRGLERRLDRIDQRIDRLDRRFDRFDEWESCLSWLPVTESGDDYQDLGYLFRPGDAAPSDPSGHLPAIDVDATEWDDPDYELLVFQGRDRPFEARECGNEPGEGVDRSATGPRPLTSHPRLARVGADDRLEDLRGELRSSAEDVADLREPAEEFTSFDECMFVIGLQERGGRDHGYEYVARDGAVRHRSALSYDLDGLDLPELDVMAFPGEEPPQIECNEDAGGQDTEE